MTNLFPYLRRIALAGLLAGTAMFHARAATVDDFLQNQAAISGAGNSTQDGSMLGGERDLQVIQTAGAISAGASLGVLNATGNATANGTVSIVWDGNDNNATVRAPNGLAGANLTTGGDNALLLGIKSLSGSPTISITVVSGGTPVTIPVPGLTASAQPQLVRVSYSAFVGANFANVGAIQLDVTALAGATVEIDFLRTGSTTAPVFEALMTDVLLADNDANGKASPGDTIRYVVTIRNNDGTAKTAVQFTANTPANTTGPANVTATPIARPEGPSSSTSAPGETYHGAFNTTLNVAAPGLLSNDYLGAPAATVSSFGVISYPGSTPNEAVTAHTAGTPANFGGNTLTVNANGSATLVPSSAFTGLILVRYRIGNTSGSSDATNTIAIGVRPAAVTDAYNVTGNTMIDTTLGGLASLTANDTGSQISITGNTAASKGTVTRTGANFTYNPNPGATGADSFTYTLNNGFGDVTGTVNLTIANELWYIDSSSVAATEDGRSSTPFKTLANFNTANTGASAAVPGDNDSVFIRQAAYANNVAGGALVLRSGQRVIGDGWSGTFNAAFGFDLASGSAKGAGVPVPAFTGTDPTIANSTANGIALASGNTIGGLTVGNTPSGFGLSGTAVGALTVTDASKTGTGGAISITTSGTFGSTVNFNTLESASSTGANLNLVGVTGTLAANSWGAGFAGSPATFNAINISGGSVSFTYPVGVTKSTTGALLNVAGGHTGTLTFQTGTLSATAGTGLQFDNADGTYNFNGTTTLSDGDAGVDILNGSTGTFTFGTGTTITHNTGIGPAFNLNNSNANVTYSGSITDNNGRVVDIDSHDSGTVTFQTGSISSGAPSGLGIRVINSNGGSVNFNGQVTLNTGTGNAIDMNTGNGGGTVNFNAALAIATTSGTGILGTGGGTVNFNPTGSGLDITTTTGTGILATGLGTITVTGSGNTISSTTGTALNISDTTIGDNDVTFQSISAGTAASGAPAMGIRLNNTGSGGGLIVTGTGSSGTGGTIQRCTHGIYANNSHNISLSWMNILNNGQNQALPGSDGSVGGNLRAGNNLSAVANITLFTVNTVSLTGLSVTGSGQMGVNGNNVTTFTMSNCAITGNGNEAFENGLTFQNLKGTCSILHSMIKDNAAYQIAVANIQNSSTLTLGITGTRVNNVYPTMDTSTTEIGKTTQSNTFTDQSLLFDTVGTATSVNMTLNLTGVVFKNSLPGNSVLINPIAASGTLGGTTTGCSFDNTAGGVIIQAQNGMSGVYNVNNSEFNRVNLQSILYAGANPFNGALSGTISGNHIGEDQTGTAGEGCDPAGGNCNGIQVNFIGGSGSISARIQNNSIQKFGGNGIRVTANGTSSPDVNLNIANNTISNPSGLIAHGMDISIGTTASANVDGCIAMTGNNISGTYEDPGVGVQLGIVTNVRFNSFFRLPGYAGSSTDTSAVAAFIVANNTTGGKVFAQRGGSGTYPGGAACVTP